MATETPEGYVRKIRNPYKRAHAAAVLAALRAGQEPPSAPVELSVMAAQAVQMRLAGMVRREN